MEILSPEDRVVLWRSVIDAEGQKRETLLHVIAKEIIESLSALDLYSEDYERLTIDSLQTLDDAGLFARDSVRQCLELIHEPEGGVDLLAAEVAGLLREAAGIEHLDADRRVRSVEMAAEWREHVLGRQQSEPELLSVGDVAARFGVTTQAVYKWLKNERIEAMRSPGGSWRVPAAQFDRDDRPATSRERLDRLQAQLIRLHKDTETASEVELGCQGE
jgi:excisionase family DNA binding protein